MKSQENVLVTTKLHFMKSVAFQRVGKFHTLTSLKGKV